MKRMYSELNEVYDQIEAAIQNDPILNTNGDFKALMQDKEFLRNYHLREMAMSDWTTGINTAVEKKQIEIARNSLNEGLPVEIIHKFTGLDIETIQSL
jgi:hypothetical protein